jgi:hypothetical protein
MRTTNKWIICLSLLLFMSCGEEEEELDEETKKEPVCQLEESDELATEDEEAELQDEETTEDLCAVIASSEQPEGEEAADGGNAQVTETDEEAAGAEGSVELAVLAEPEFSHPGHLSKIYGSHDVAMRTLTFSHDGSAAECSSDDGATYKACSTLNSFVWTMEEYNSGAKLSVKLKKEGHHDLVKTFDLATKYPGLKFIACDEIVSADENFGSFKTRIDSGKTICLGAGVTILNSSSEDYIYVGYKNDVIFVGTEENTPLLESQRTDGSAYDNSVLFISNVVNFEAYNLNFKTATSGSSLIFIGSSSGTSTDVIHNVYSEASFSHYGTSNLTVKHSAFGYFHSGGSGTVLDFNFEDVEITGSINISGGNITGTFDDVRVTFAGVGLGGAVDIQGNFFDIRMKNSIIRTKSFGLKTSGETSKLDIQNTEFRHMGDGVYLIGPFYLLTAVVLTGGDNLYCNETEDTNYNWWEYGIYDTFGTVSSDTFEGAVGDPGIDPSGMCP